MKVNIIGSGAWGTALHTVISKNISDVYFLNKEEIITDADIIIISVPVQNIRAAITDKKFTKEKVIFVNTAKGVEKSTHKFPYEIIQEVLGSKIDYFTLSGPSFALEVKEEMPTVVNLGFSKSDNLDIVKNIFKTDYFKIVPTRGVEILELFGALKNVYAIVCGLADGLGYQNNTRVKIILAGLEELHALANNIDYQIDNYSLPATLGDLMLTCNSNTSRNFRFGQMLAKLPPEECLKNICETVEGYHTIYSISHLAERYKVNMPLATFIANVVSRYDLSNINYSFRKIMRSSVD